jgi:hypothetical protein
MRWHKLINYLEKNEIKHNYIPGWSEAYDNVRFVYGSIEYEIESAMNAISTVERIESENIELKHFYQELSDYSNVEELFKTINAFETQRILIELTAEDGSGFQFDDVETLENIKSFDKDIDYLDDLVKSFDKMDDIQLLDEITELREEYLKYKIIREFKTDYYRVMNETNSRYDLIEFMENNKDIKLLENIEIISENATNLIYDDLMKYDKETSNGFLINKIEYKGNELFIDGHNLEVYHNLNDFEIDIEEYLERVEDYIQAYGEEPEHTQFMKQYVEISSRLKTETNKKFDDDLIESMENWKINENETLEALAKNGIFVDYPNEAMEKYGYTPNDINKMINDSKKNPTDKPKKKNKNML